VANNAVSTADIKANNANKIVPTLINPKVRALLTAISGQRFFEGAGLFDFHTLKV
jgi:hypothetical protein